MSAQLSPGDWEINGDSLTHWVSDLELYDVRPVRPSYAAYYNHVGQALAVFLGFYPTIPAAQAAARHHLIGA